MSKEKINNIAAASLELMKTYIENVDLYAVHRALQLLRMHKEYSYWRPTTPTYVRDMPDSCIEELNNLLAKSAVTRDRLALDLREDDPVIRGLKKCAKREAEDLAGIAKKALGEMVARYTCDEAVLGDL